MHKTCLFTTKNKDNNILPINLIIDWITASDFTD